MQPQQLLARIGRAASPWSATLALLEYWQGRPRHRRPAHDRFRAPHTEWSKLQNEVRLHFEDASSKRVRLNDADRDCIRAWLGATFEFDRVDAIAWGIDAGASRTFAATWRQDLGLERRVITLQPGEPYPIGTPELDSIGEGWSTDPASATDPRENELPHVRFFKPPTCKWITEVEFDFGYWDRLHNLLSGLREVATVHPNSSRSEWGKSPPGSSLFPLVLNDAAGQESRIVRLVQQARNTDFKAQIVVAPELAATARAVAAVQADLDQGDADVMVVAGSEHVVDQGRPVNRAFALMPSAEPLRHDKMVPLRRLARRQRAEQIEGIDANPVLRVYQADQFRLALLICKDFLDTDLVDDLCRLGINVVVVPAMSSKTRRFATGAAQLVDRTQGIAIIANGPYQWGPCLADPASVFGQPFEAKPVVVCSPTGDCFTGFAPFQLGSSPSSAHWVAVRV